MTNDKINAGSEALFTEALFDLSHTSIPELFSGCRYPWEALPLIAQYVRSYGESLSEAEYYSPSEGVYISREAKVEPTASIAGPCVIEAGAEVRHCAYIRGSVIVGKGAVVGNSTELKNAVLFDGVQVPHYNYVGDSILGYRAHMGAGSIASNVKGDKKNVVVKTADGTIETGLRKFGAILGDFAEIGCGSVLNPGTVVGRCARVYPLSSVRGSVPAGHIYKHAGKIAEIIPDAE